MLVLASGSERRKEILERAGLEFIQCVPDVEEVLGKDVYDSAMKNALAKARWCAERYPGHPVVGFDTVVTVGGRVLGKPSSRAEASRFLSMLSGNVHTVITGIAIVCLARKIEVSSFEETKVFFRKLSEEEIEWYLNTREWEGKAGAYGIQGRASLFVERIEGCYFNVVGLPVGKMYGLLEELGIECLPTH
ncbi:MAG: Maf family protein [Thermoplasmata archaeon]|nr:Maf family protein [Thermoplasmata archaeon]